MSLSMEDEDSIWPPCKHAKKAVPKPDSPPSTPEYKQPPPWQPDSPPNEQPPPKYPPPDSQHQGQPTGSPQSCAADAEMVDQPQPQQPQPLWVPPPKYPSPASLGAGGSATSSSWEHQEQPGWQQQCPQSSATDEEDLFSLASAGDMDTGDLGEEDLGEESSTCWMNALPAWHPLKRTPKEKPTKEVDFGRGAEIYCAVCDMWLNGPAQLDDHKITARHRKAVKAAGRNEPSTLRPPRRCQR